jgi:predicted N-acyltransferase
MGDQPFHSLTCNSIEALGYEAWDTLSDRSFYLGRKWLTTRSATIGGPGLFTMIVDRQQRPIAGFPAYLVNHTSYGAYDPYRILSSQLLDIDGQPTSRSEAAAILRMRAVISASQSLTKSALVIAAPGRAGGFAFSPGLDAREKEAALSASLAAVDAAAAKTGVSAIAFLYLPRSGLEQLLPLLADRGYAALRMDNLSYLRVEWNDFAGYLSSFKAGRRKSIQREIRTFKRAEVDVHIEGVESLGPELAGLELAWRQKYGRAIKLDEILKQHVLIQQNLAEETVVFVGRLGSRTIGFTCFFREGDIMYSRFGGFDYSAGRLFSYFNLLFYEPIRHAILHGYKLIEYSTGVCATKASRGCHSRELMMYVQFDEATMKEIQPGLAILNRLRRGHFA